MSGNSVALRDVVRSLHEPGWNYGHDRSPFYRYLVAEGASYCVYNRRMMPVSVETSTRDEGYWALRRGVVRLDTGELPTEIAGPDAARLLDRIFTRRVSTLKPGRCTYGVACWPDGGILVDGILARLDGDRYWYVQADGDFVGWLRAHAVGLDVQIRDPQSWVHQIQGPKSLELLARAVDDGEDAALRYFEARTLRIGGQEVLVTRTGWTSELGFEVYTHPGLDTDALWEHFTAIGKEFDMLEVGLDAFEARRIEAGILNNLSDMDAGMTPYQAGLGSIVDLKRDDDFFGKQALRDADTRTLIHGVSSDAEPLIGSTVSRGGSRIGRITAASWSPYLKKGVGLVRLDNADFAEGGPVQIIGFDLTTHSADLVELPFYDPTKAIPRGLEASDVG